MIVADIPCPWPFDGPIILDHNNLTRQEKWYLGQQVASGESTVKSIVNRYGLNKRTISDYKKKVPLSS